MRVGKGAGVQPSDHRGLGHTMLGVQLIVPTLASLRDPEIDHGEVFTRRWVAELVLDLADYRIGSELDFAIDMLGKLTTEPDVYDTACLLVVDTSTTVDDDEPEQ